MAIRLIKWVHLAVLVFVLFGWALPGPTVWLVHGIFVPIMIVQWWVNDGTCILTNLENWVAGKKKEKDEEQGQFVKGLLSKCFDPLPSDEKIKVGLYGVLIISCSLSWLRYFT